MKKTLIRLAAIHAAVLLALVSGCVTNKQTEDLLTAAGFKAQPATTPEQQAHLKSLPAHKVTTVQRGGKQYFVYPDAAHHVLYVGQSAQYEQYQKLLAKEMAEYENTPAEDMETNYAVWGDW
jgi:hypothetical protein